VTDGAAPAATIAGNRVMGEDVKITSGRWILAAVLSLYVVCDVLPTLKSESRHSDSGNLRPWK